MDDIPEVSPIRFDVADVKGFKQHLTEHGCAFAVSPALRCLHFPFFHSLQKLVTRPPEMYCVLDQREWLTNDSLTRAEQTPA